MSVTLEKTRVPVTFEKIGGLDDRFQRVKVKIAHTGENLNNSYFSKESLESMIPTLSNIPIVGFIEKNDDGEDDFSDHRQNITLTDDGVKIEYAGHAYGFIPEDNNARFEVSGGKEWLVAEGYLWTKFKNALSIFGDSNGIKSQSMEIQDISGEADEIGRLVINSGRFSALCILGEDVTPAMTGSTLELFSAKLNNGEVDEMMAEFAETKIKRKKGGYDDLDDIIEEKPKEDIVTDPVDPADKDNGVEGDSEHDSDTGSHDGGTDSGDDDGTDGADDKDSSDTTDSDVGAVDNGEVGGVAEGETEAQEEEVESENPAEEDETAEESEAEESEGGEETEEFSSDKEMKFELSHNAIYSEIQESVNTILNESMEDFYAYPVEVYDESAIIRVNTYKEGNKFLNVKYTKSDSALEITDLEEVYAMFLSGEEKVKIENNRTQISELESQIEQLQEYKNSKEEEFKLKVVSEFEANLDEEIIDEIKSKFSVMSIEDVEKEVAFQLYKNSKDLITDTVETKAVNFSASSQDNRYGALTRFFNS